MSRPEPFDERVAREHRQLAPLFDETLTALRQRNLRAIREAVARLLSALETHLAQEDRVYYPALSRLHPEARSDLARFSEFHRRFLEEFREMQQLIEDRDFRSAADRFHSFSRAFAVHEVHEEDFLGKLESARTSPPR